MVSRRTCRTLESVKSRDQRCCSEILSSLLAEHTQLARHGRLQDQPFAGVDQILRHDGRFRERFVQPLESTPVAGIYEQPIHHAEKIVAGSAGDVPIRAEFFAPHQNLLRHDVETLACLSRRHTRLLQATKIFRRIEEAVGMVHPQTVDDAVLHQIEH